MGDKNAQLHKEECRRLVMGYLAARQVLAFRVEAIRRGLVREEAAEFTDAEIVSALEFLKGLGFADSAPDALGSTLSWQATSAGVLAHERGQA